MNAPLPQHEAWLLANQQGLAAALAACKRWLRGEAPPQPTPRGDLALDEVANAFALSDFEREVLLVAAGVEMDAELAAAVSTASAAPHRGLTFGLLLAGLAPIAHWSALAPQAPLRRWQLVQVDEAAGVTAGRLRIDERILHLLAGINALDARLQPLVRAHASTPQLAPSQQVQAETLAARLAEAPAGRCLVHLGGSDTDGRVDLAAASAQALGLGLHTLAASELPESAVDQALLALLWQREARLLGSALAVVADGGAESARLERWLARAEGLVFVCQPDPPALPCRHSLTVHKPAADEQRLLWQAARPTLDAPVLDQLASRFRFSARQIAERADDGASLLQSCRDAARARLQGLAQAVPTAAGWDDLVLPEPLIASLQRMAAQLRHRLTVHDRWGFARQGNRGLGMAALFCGDSGTGKTMACEVLARELELDLYRIDLAAVVSKYIGETEKNLQRVFDAAEDSAAILLFDEADALFGKRSEVKDSHDRYANIEVSYLLQRMEAYRGLAVLTTNQRSALDTAFLRRLRFVLNFPFPDAAQRARIWQRVFPSAMPRGDIDVDKLAALPLAGGAIRNIAINAAFAAAADGGVVHMAHLAQAAQQEAAKTEGARAEPRVRGW